MLQKEILSVEVNVGSSGSCPMALTMLKAKSFTFRTLMYEKNGN